MQRSMKIAATALTSLVLSLGCVLPAQAASYEADSGTTTYITGRKEAWAWVNVWNNTQGKAYAQMDSAKYDTGWFTKDCRTARAWGSTKTKTVVHNYYVR